MCSNCDYTRYIQIDGNTIGKSIGLGKLEIRCDHSGNNYKIAIQGEDRSAINIYRCPTCGRKLY